ncbi:unnamed protein product [Diatraea saccharalis]|uniref:Adenylate kinase n=1 Tax=Diatraea saccharalis TaxID=40085 RepID=A0A9N9QWB0_9NEOP|nr:unnamed protein product [Diatraea saccharalis]
MNGVSGVGVGAGGIPGEIVGVEPAPNVTERDTVKEEKRPETTVLPVAAPVVVPIQQENVWVVGGPGSNKASLCERAVARRDGWTHFSVGQRLRALADAGGGPASDGALARAAVSGGEQAPRELVGRLVKAALSDAARTAHGLVLDGYPRDMEQLEHFQKEPRMLLLDCSKLQLGRGRRDDSVAAFRRRLEVFRELSLPMLKHLDQNHRLVIVDGDTDSTEVQEEFTQVLLEEMEKAEALAAMPEQPPTPKPNGTAVQQFAHAMARMSGGMGNGFANGALRNGTAHNGILPNGNVANGFANMANNKVRKRV